MKIKILSFSHKDYPACTGSKILQRRAKEMGYDAKIIRKHHCQFDFTGKKMRFLYRNKPLKADVVIVRAGFNDNYDFHASTIKQLQLCGYTVVNKHLPVIYTKNKIRTMQILAKHHIPIPRTVVVRDRDYVESAANRIGDYPLIIKKACGLQGKGVVLVPDQQTMSSVMDVLMNEYTDDEYMLQEYVKEAEGRDIRVFIVGGKIIAAMERKAKAGEFRSNFHLGGSIAAAELSPEEKSAALKAAKVVSLEVAGVDLLRTSDGPKILEVNSNPGFEGIEKATEIDVSGSVIKYAVKKAKSESTRKANKESNIKDKIQRIIEE